MTTDPTNQETTMTTPTTISIDGIDYIRADAQRPDAQRPDHSDSPIRILVLQRGWVAIGRYGEDGERVFLDDASIIRKWGTTKGLGELVDGPTSATVLDPIGHIECHILGVVMSVACSDRWPL